MQNGVGPLLKEKKGEKKYVGNKLWSVCESFYKRTTRCNKMTRCGTAVKRSLGCASVLGSLANKPVPPRKKEPNTDGSRFSVHTFPFLVTVRLSLNFTIRQNWIIFFLFIFFYLTYILSGWELHHSYKRVCFVRLKLEHLTGHFKIL